MTNEVRLPNAFNFFRSAGPFVGAGLLILAFVLGIFLGEDGAGPLQPFVQSWLNAFLLVSGVAIGSLAVLYIHHMTSGAWSFVIQRILEANTRTLPLILLFFIPIFAQPFIGGIYDVWVHPSGEFTEPIENKEAYLNTNFWALRSVIYFAVFFGMMTLLNSWSKRLEETPDALMTLRFRRFSPPAIIVWCLLMTFAALDWYMSLTPAWFSTIYGPLTWIGQGLTIVAFSTIVLSYLSEVNPLSRYVKVEHFHNLGNFMMAYTVLWAYMSFSQFLIIWSGNLPEEIHWYLIRNTNGLNVLAVILMLFHFFLPLLILLQRWVSTNVGRLRRMCFYVLVVRSFDAFWVVNPSYHIDAPGIRWQEVLLYALTLAGMALIWFWYFLRQLSKRSLLPMNDPRFHDAVGLGHEPAHAEAHGHA